MTRLIAALRCAAADRFPLVGDVAAGRLPVHSNSLRVYLCEWGSALIDPVGGYDARNFHLDATGDLWIG